MGGGLGAGLGAGGPSLSSGGMGGLAGGLGASGKSPVDGETVFEANVFTFVVQMAWEPRTVKERIEAKRVREEAKAAADAAAAAAKAAAIDQ